MNAANQPLFRGEALRFKAERLHGNVNLAVPVSWQVIGILLLSGVVAAIAFLASASYARVETAAGVITLSTGVAAVLPSRAGVIETVGVIEGQHVKSGQPLLRVRAENDLLGGNTASSRTRAALAEQDARLREQGSLTMQAASAEQARLHEQIVGDRAELGSLEAQSRDQERLIATASSDLENAKRIAASGFISRRDLDLREATLLSRRQQLAQLEQLAAAKRADMAGAQRAIAQAGLGARAQAATAGAGRASLQGQIAQADLSQGYVVSAPVDGLVTALTARPGQAVATDQQLMMVVPSASRPMVEIYVPTSAAGFIAPGQEVRLAVDAFPYQTFGTVAARIRGMSRAAVTRPGANGDQVVYLVTADLARPSVMAFGRRHRLLPGMNLSARIVTERRSLLQWLFEPLFAVRDR